jgi:hypothetical protein
MIRNRMMPLLNLHGLSPGDFVSALEQVVSGIGRCSLLMPHHREQQAGQA